LEHRRLHSERLLTGHIFVIDVGFRTSHSCWKPRSSGIPLIGVVDTTRRWASTT
jgi:hypothetical protein